MKKTVLGLALALMGCVALPVQAQLAFWNYDDSDNESQIPAECDGIFDESRGGVFLPDAAEMAARGEEFLLDADPTIRSKAGYCLIGAALQGDIPSQYRVAQLYSKGIVLPQDDLSAYRWAFLASLNGHEEAGKLALLLERFLTTKDIEDATKSVTSMLPSITNRYQQELAAQQQRVNEKQAELDRINDEIDTLLGVKTKPTAELSQTANMPAPGSVEQIAAKAVPHDAIFSSADRK